MWPSWQMELWVQWWKLPAGMLVAAFPQAWWMEKQVHFVNGAANKGAHPYAQAVYVNNQRTELRTRFSSLCRIHAVIHVLFACLSIYVYPRVHNHLSEDACNYRSLNISLEFLQWHCWVPHHPNESMVHPPTHLSITYTPHLAGSPSLKRDRVKVRLQKPELDQCFSCLTQYNCQ